MIIGITGTFGAGKGTIVNFLKEKGFSHYSVREFLIEELSKRGLDTNRDNMVSVANDLRAKFGASHIVEELFRKAKEKGGDAVIESVRCVGEVEALRKKDDFVFWAVEADVEIRYTRIVERKSSTDGVSFQYFVKQETNEMENTDPMKQNLKACIEMADIRFRNDWTASELKGKVDKALEDKKTRNIKEKNVSSVGLLSDGQIKRKVKNREIEIVPFDDRCVQPASYDLHLDNRFKIFRPHLTEIIDTKNPVKDLMEDVKLDKNGFFVLHPGSFALGLIKEVTGVDNKHVGRLEGKSSLARLGLIIHTTAGFLDPGNSLQMTLELFNASPLPIKLYPGMKIAQMAFEELSEACEVPYGKARGSSYYGASEIQESQMHKNFEEFDEENGLYNPKE